MAYSSITKPTDHFNTVLYTGNGNTNLAVTGVEFQPDWVWIKARTTADYNHMLFDAVRGATKYVKSDTNSAENTLAETLKSFDSDGFTLGNQAYTVNDNTIPFASWNWLAAGTTPSQTYTVKVVSDGGNKYRFDDYGTSAVTLDLQEGGTYTFDGSDSSMASHPIKLSETSNGTHGGGSSYNTGVTYQLDGSSVTESAYVSGYSSASSRKLIITVAASAPTLYYYCHYHSGMGGQVNTNSTHGSSNFSGSMQANVSVNTTAGFSVATFTASGSGDESFGHGLGAKPKVMFLKSRSNSGSWGVYHENTDASAPEDDYLNLNGTAAKADLAGVFGAGMTSSVAGVGVGVGFTSGHTYVGYCFAEKKGFSKFGSYVGNNSTDGTFIYTGFKPAWVLLKIYSGTTGAWTLFDNKRDPFNEVDNRLFPDTYGAESDGNDCDFLSNGFKHRTTGSGTNGNGYSYIYMAFAENPFVANDSGTAVPVTAR